MEGNFGIRDYKSSSQYSRGLWGTKLFWKFGITLG